LDPDINPLLDSKKYFALQQLRFLNCNKNLKNNFLETHLITSQTFLIAT
jgi:hypothetical protein